MSICPAQKTGCISFVAKGITVFQLCKSTGLQTEVTAGDLSGTWCWTAGRLCCSGEGNIQWCHVTFSCPFSVLWLSCRMNRCWH